MSPIVFILLLALGVSLIFTVVAFKGWDDTLDLNKKTLRVLEETIHELENAENLIRSYGAYQDKNKKPVKRTRKVATKKKK